MEEKKAEKEGGPLMEEKKAKGGLTDAEKLQNAKKDLKTFYHIIADIEDELETVNESITECKALIKELEAKHKEA